MVPPSNRATISREPHPLNPKLDWIHYVIAKAVLSLALTAVWKLSYAMKDGLLPIAGEKSRLNVMPNPKGTAEGPTIRVVLYARVSSKDQEKEGFSIPAQLRLLRDYAASTGFEVAEEFTDVETAKASGRTNFGQILAYLEKNPRTCRTILVEKTDRLYRNLTDYATR